MLSRNNSGSQNRFALDFTELEVDSCCSLRCTQLPAGAWSRGLWTCLQMQKQSRRGLLRSLHPCCQPNRRAHENVGCCAGNEACPVRGGGVGHYARSRDAGQDRSSPARNQILQRVDRRVNHRAARSSCSCANRTTCLPSSLESMSVSAHCMRACVVDWNLYGVSV